MPVIKTQKVRFLVERSLGCLTLARQVDVPQIRKPLAAERDVNVNVLDADMESPPALRGPVCRINLSQDRSD